MLVARIYAEEWEVDARLKPFGVTRRELVEVARGVVGARADAVENDPVTAAGLFAYIFGTRFLRSLFRTKGWLIHRKENIEAVRHPDRDLRVIYQSVDLAASRQHNPQAVSGKGSAADRIIDAAQGSLFTEEQLAAANVANVKQINVGVWFYCVSVEGDDVRAELSLPSSIEGGNFRGFIERIFIIRGGEWARLETKPDAEAAAEFQPVITRK